MGPAGQDVLRVPCVLTPHPAQGGSGCPLPHSSSSVSRKGQEGTCRGSLLSCATTAHHGTPPPGWIRAALFPFPSCPGRKSGWEHPSAARGQGRVVVRRAGGEGLARQSRGAARQQVELPGKPTQTPKLCWHNRGQHRVQGCPGASRTQQAHPRASCDRGLCPKSSTAGAPPASPAIVLVSAARAASSSSLASPARERGWGGTTTPLPPVPAQPHGLSEQTAPAGSVRTERARQKEQTLQRAQGNMNLLFPPRHVLAAGEKRSLQSAGKHTQRTKQRAPRRHSTRSRRAERRRIGAPPPHHTAAVTPQSHRPPPAPWHRGRPLVPGPLGARCPPGPGALRQPGARCQAPSATHRCLGQQLGAPQLHQTPPSSLPRPCPRRGAL